MKRDITRKGTWLYLSCGHHYFATYARQCKAKTLECHACRRGEPVTLPSNQNLKDQP